MAQIKGGGRLDEETKIQSREQLDYTKIKQDLKALPDATLSLGTYKKINRSYGDKKYVLERINRRDYETLREISNFYYESSGIYYRICRYMAYLYRYDWFITPFNLEKTTVNEKKILNDFARALIYLDNSHIRRLSGNIFLEVMKYGVYYGYVIDHDDYFTIQQLPTRYCRCRFYSGVKPVVELDMSFIDTLFPLLSSRMKIINLLPKDIQKGYLLYKQGKLTGEKIGDMNHGWYMLDPDLTVRFCLNNSEFPPLVNAIPSIIDLDEAQDLDRQKTMQQLLKIIVQKLPLDKNGDLIFDMEEARDIHNMAVGMLKRAVGIDVLTTFAEIDKIDTKDSNAATSKDDLEKVERTVFNDLGVSRNLFNAEGNLAVTNSILNDEASVRDLVFQLSEAFDARIQKFNRKSQYTFKFNMLETTQYNYRELSKMYKEQVQIGYSKMLPQVALGHSQSSIIATAQFENNVLHLSDIMIPPLSSNTMSSSKVLDKNSQTTQQKNQSNQTGQNKSAAGSAEEKTPGRPEKEDSDKSDKTLRNREAMS